MTRIYTINAPLSGTVESLKSKSGAEVTTGEPVIVLESMKVHVQVKSDVNGMINELFVNEGDTVERGEPLFKIKESGSSIDTELKQNSIPNHKSEHSLIAQFHQRQAMALDSHRQTAQQKRHAKGYRTARENLGDLCDIDSFQEYGQFAVAAQRGKRDYDILKTETAADGIITGIGAVNHELFGDKPSQTALVINDYSVLAGTQGYFHHLKLDRLLALAGQQRLPIIMFTEGGGGRPNDTDVTTVNSGLQCGSFSTWAGMADGQNKVPRIAVANGYNFAGNAALFGAADITIATKNSWIGMAGPAMIEGGGLGNVKATDIGPIEVQSRNGVVDIVADDERHACHLAKHALSFLQGSVDNYESHDQSLLNSALPENRKEIYDVRAIIERIADKQSVLEIKPEFGASIVTAFIRLEGQAMGVMASNCAVLGGAIDADAGEKTSDFIDLCHRFELPILSLCDTPGFMVGPAHEELGAVRRLAKLFAAGARHTAPFIAVVLRKCYGLGAQAMLGGNTMMPDYTLSWPTGEFGPMGLEGAVKLGFRKDLEAEQSEEKRAALFDKLVNKQYRRGHAIEVASALEIDAVIDPSETRVTLARCLQRY